MKKAIFLDRDGTLNPDPGYISDPKDFELFADVGKALSKLQKAGYLLILVTNQSGISRGLISLPQLEAVHDKLERLLQQDGVKLDAIYYCPHHPDHPYEGITHCNCRKPEPGLILKAISDFDIDPASSYMIGDRSSDIKIALKSSVKPILIGKTPIAGFENVSTYETLSLAADAILNNPII
ncbi:MAG: HAD family hydrolase [Candidatus Riflebacteria bacterium]|nr:HAD family hydrolase [Candidatus Riflebacteria bacterium]